MTTETVGVDNGNTRQEQAESYMLENTSRPTDLAPTYKDISNIGSLKAEDHH